jgi:hypothetical protein
LTKDHPVRPGHAPQRVWGGSSVLEGPSFSWHGSYGS